jgi:hypothetical protein
MHAAFREGKKGRKAGRSAAKSSNSCGRQRGSDSSSVVNPMVNPLPSMLGRSVSMIDHSSGTSAAIRQSSFGSTRPSSQYR